MELINSVLGTSNIICGFASDIVVSSSQKWINKNEQVLRFSNKESF